MPSPPNDIQTLEQRRAELKAKLSEVGDLRPGSLTERYRRCGKTGCHCAGMDSEGHGPSWSLTREVGGKTVTRVIPARAVAQTREQIAEHRRFRGLVRELVESSEQLCDAKLETRQAAPEEADEKGGSGKHSTRKSSPRSKRS
ncbi:MAG: hypothetical protein IT186_24765 [Acidobacteria bacterium]|nr:hypothetical protein [Acidobacteriota bacterium]